MTVYRRGSIAALAGCCLVIMQAATAQELQRPNASTVIKPVVKPSAANPEAADGTRGMALLGAVINADGTLFAGSGVTSSSRFVLGGYRVFFDRNVVPDCTYATAAVGTSQTYVRIVARSTNELQFNTNAVETRALTDASFSVTVFCPK